MDKRKFLQTASAITVGVALQPMTACKNLTKGAAATGQGIVTKELLPLSGPFVLPELGYVYHALEPAIDALTMEIHHTKHHAAYVNNLNKALESAGSRFAGQSLERILQTLSREDTAIRNNGGGHWNHSAFWQWISPGGAKSPAAGLMAAIQRDFGSFESFQQKFEDAAKTRFGSGWAWLIVGKDKNLAVSSTPNQDNPLMVNLVDLPGKPILGLDVWEHAYYLKYQNKRPDYIAAFRSLINWDVVQRYYEAALLG